MSRLPNVTGDKFKLYFSIKVRFEILYLFDNKRVPNQDPSGTEAYRHLQVFIKPICVIIERITFREEMTKVVKYRMLYHCIC